MIRKLGLCLLFCGILTGCRTSAFQYLDVPENEGRIIVDQWNKTTRIKPVRETSYFNFETLERAGLVENVQLEGEYVYYSVVKRVPVNKTISLAPGEGEYVTIIERFRVNMDKRLRER